jgi:hypothetical protein
MFKMLLRLTVLACLSILVVAAKAQSQDTYSSNDILTKGKQFFGGTTRGLAEAIEYTFSKNGEPTAYIIGSEGSGAIVGGLRYGQGTIFYKNGAQKHIYWQGPSLGIDFGGNGSRTMTLVYNSQSPEDLYFRFATVDGSAYLIGGVGVNFERGHGITLAPIRTGLGARLGANVGYTKYSPKSTWNPF